MSEKKGLLGVFSSKINSFYKGVKRAVTLSDQQKKSAEDGISKTTRSVGAFRNQVLIDPAKYENLLLGTFNLGNKDISSDNDFNNLMVLIRNHPLIKTLAKNIPIKILNIDSAGTGVDLNFKISKIIKNRCVEEIDEELSEEEEKKEIKEKEFLSKIMDDAYNKAVQSIGVLSGKTTNAYNMLSHAIVVSALEGYSFLIWVSIPKKIKKNGFEETIIEKKFIHRVKDDLQMSETPFIKDYIKQQTGQELYFANGMIKCAYTGEIKFFCFQQEGNSAGAIIIPEDKVVLIGFKYENNKDLFLPFFIDQLGTIQSIMAIQKNLANKVRLEATISCMVSPKAGNDPISSAGSSMNSEDVAIAIHQAIEEMKKDNNAINVLFSKTPIEVTQLNSNIASQGIELLKHLFAFLSTSLYSTYTECSGDSANDNFASAQAQQLLLSNRVTGLHMMLSGDIRKFANIILNEVVYPELRENFDFHKLVVSKHTKKYEIDFDLIFAKIKSLDPLKDTESLLRLVQSGVMSKETLIKMTDLDPNEELPKIMVEKRSEAEMRMAEAEKMSEIAAENNNTGEKDLKPKRPYNKSGKYVGQNIGKTQML